MASTSASASSSISLVPRSTTASTAPTPTPTSGLILPHPNTMLNAAKLAIEHERPIMLDYYYDSVHGKALIGVRPNGDKLLVKSSEEYTSTVVKLYKSETDIIVMTENSIYIVSKDIPSRRINPSAGSA